MKKGLGVIRVSTKKQLDGHTIDTQKRIIDEICKKENIGLVGFKIFRDVSGRKEDSIESYMNEIRKLIDKYNVDCLVLWKTSRLGRMLPEIYHNVKDLIDNHVTTIYTKNLTITKDSFKFFDNRMMLYMNFMLDEAEGYSIYERMFEGKKTKALNKLKDIEELKED